ncbi:MAG: sugar phosphate isomerase/epimerase [Gemmatimonadetes bacterium]|jgi:sugar phosphate isomerase/epimerase|nr:sugar phosphate isomerase/epimerase [Gemmatimonadota bacterium]MBT6148049.1 sugar phosphate isomerase/epimerase [Gemmatimonadota bacterium]MBT7861250.1 sugar phosphate isomerase/epimerase [Gemmatimonadota bacterium]
MKLIVFSKMLNEKSVEELADLAQELGIDGYDLAVRAGHPVNPENVTEALPAALQLFRDRGLDIPLITAEGDLVDPSVPAADTLLAAMADAGAPRVKLGYYKIDLDTPYWDQVDTTRRQLEGWGELAAKRGVQVVYHTHSNRCMGLNAGMLMHLLKGLDPSRVGAYLDTGHLVGEGEEFVVATKIAAEHLTCVSLKDFNMRRGEKANHGTKVRDVVEAGLGMVDWTSVFSELSTLGFDGPASIHCEFQTEDDFLTAVRREAAFFIEHRRQAFG